MIKKVLFLLAIGVILQANSQDYSFSQTTGSYTNLTSTTILANDDWSEFQIGVKIPFSFKFWGQTVSDSLYLDDFGTISLDNDYNGEISILGDDMSSRGAGKSIISAATTGTSPNRIFILEFKNVGFDADGLLFKDSANTQCWIYETSNIIEFRYGSNKVKSTSWSDEGAFVSLINSDFTKFIILQKNPASPTVNKSSIFTATSLTGMPTNGTIYKFTPSTTNSVSGMNAKFNVIENKLQIPANLEVSAIQLYNSNGQLLQTVSKSEELNLNQFTTGIYFIKVATTSGVISQKIYLNN